MAKALLKKEVHHLIFNEIYLRFTDPKAQRKAFSLIEATIQCLARKGFDEVSLEMIAREAGITRPLLKHYFADEDEIKLTAIKYVRLVFQKVVLDATMKERTPDQMLRAYVSSCFVWTENFRTHGLVWFAFLLRAGRNPRWRELNTAAVQAGEERIATLIQTGKDTGFFKCGDPVEVAKMVQVIITGSMVTLGSENLADAKSFAQLATAQCLKLVGTEA